MSHIPPLSWGPGPAEGKEEKLHVNWSRATLLSQQHKHRLIFLEFGFKDPWRLNIPGMGSSGHHAGWDKELCNQCCKLMNATTFWLKNFKAKWKQDAGAPWVLMKAGQQLDRTDSSPNTYFIAPCGSWKQPACILTSNSWTLLYGCYWGGGGFHEIRIFTDLQRSSPQRGHYQLPGKVSKPGSWIKIINKNKTEHLSKDRELSKSSSSYKPRDNGWNC